MKAKVLLAVVALSCAPLGMAGNKAEYPSERVGEFVTEKLDVTSLPPVFRPKKEKGKKTIADYGFTVQRVGENETIIEATGGVPRLTIKVLDHNSSGIYACVSEPGKNGGQAKTQSVILLTRKESNAWLKGREASREFAECPVIGDNKPTTSEY